MDSPQKQTRHRIPVVDFVPAELKKGNKGNWRVEYYVIDPTAKKPTLIRKQRRVKPMTNSRERERFAKRICFEINRKLEKGWNPYIEAEASGSFALLKDVSRRFVANIEKQVKDGSLREDTLRAYRSYLSNLATFLKARGEEDLFCIKFNRQLVGEFLDYIYYERNNSPRTYNNYLGFLVLFSKYMIRKDHININPAEGYEKKKNGEKTRTIIADKDLKEIFGQMDAQDPSFGVSCKMMYYELLRRTEMSKMKVADIHLKERFILIRSEVSKNGQAQTVTLIKEFIPALAEHLRGAHNSDYLFSADNFKPGPVRTTPKSFSDRWSKWKKKMKWKKTYHFYSFKDTGITNLLRAGVPAIHVRDHARHHDISMTQKYTPMGVSVRSEFLDGKIGV